MKIFSWIVFLGLISFVLDGCVAYRTHACYLRGNCRIVQTNCVLQLETTRARYIHFGRSDGLHLVWYSQDACNVNAFVLMFKGNEKQYSIDSLHGSYKYASNDSQPLELTYLGKTNAVFLLNTINTNLPDRFKYGRYNLEIAYGFGGQTNACNFVVDYICKTNINYRPIWSIAGEAYEGLRYMSGGYGPGP